MPMTRLALRGFTSLTVGLGRAVIAGMLSAIVLFWRRDPMPSRSLLVRLAIVGFGVVLGFPWLTSRVLMDVRSTDLTVLVSGIPLATALISMTRTKERPKPRFWIVSVLGLIAVTAYPILSGVSFSPRALALGILAVALCALGYAEGGALAKQIGGFRVIAWTLVLSLPVTLTLTWLFGAPWIKTPQLSELPAAAWLGFAWVSFGSMFLAFVVWYRGMAQAGIAKVSQLQLVQPTLTMIWSTLLLGEVFSWPGLACALFAAGCIAVANRS
jgi:drug/metabolite transporter (DMT)-like permease